MASGEEDYPVTAYATAGQVSRSEVKAELAAARALGLTRSGELDYPQLLADALASAARPAPVPGATTNWGKTHA